MTFEELKFQVIDRQRRLQIDQLLYIYIKAQNYGDILRAVKSTGNLDWILRNGFRELAQNIPISELEAENIYQRDISLTDQNKDIIMLSGTLTITQSGTNRCKVISDGATINSIINDSAMLEFELYQSSYATLNINSFGYAHVLTKENSRTSINGNDNSTIKLIGYGSSETNTNLGINSFINSILYDNAKIVNLGENNLIARQRDDSQIIYGENQGL